MNIFVKDEINRRLISKIYMEPLQININIVGIQLKIKWYDQYIC